MRFTLRHNLRFSWPACFVALLWGAIAGAAQADAEQPLRFPHGSQTKTADSAAETADHQVKTAESVSIATHAEEIAAPPEMPVYPDMVPVGKIMPNYDAARGNVAHNCPRCGVHCTGCPACGPNHWKASTEIPWEMFAQGEYIGPARLPSVGQYRLRVDDLIEFVYRLDGKPSASAYSLEVGDRLRVESFSTSELDREVVIQPDGKITLRLIGGIRAAGRTMEDLRNDIDKRYKEFVKDPSISINPIEINTTANQLIATVDRRFGRGGQAQVARVTPAGTIQLPAIGSVPAQGLTVEELKHEVEMRYTRFVAGMEVTPILSERAPRYVFVVGEVAAPGRFTLEGPTTVMQAIALAGSWNIGAHLRQVVVLRRDENWQLMATRLDLRAALEGRRPCPADEIWIRDSDIVIVPQSPILRMDNFIELVFTRGVYGVVPLNFSMNFAKLSTL
ncbi:MAG: polysaccharide biosynthesis/export family protein [Planctomycetota bacterium]|nr:polysaccharide biosynthesis/export family protein [Planctomycetota bacterium]